MAKVIINQFDGGVALSARPVTLNEQASDNTGGFDIFFDPNKLTKLETPTVNEGASGASVVAGECYVLDANKRASDGRIIGVGRRSSSNADFRFYRKDTSITGNWTQNTVATASVAANNAFAVLYKDVQYGYFMGTADSRLYQYVDDSTVTLKGTTADYHTTICPRPVVHSQDNVLYMAANKTVSKFDGTTFTASAITLPFYISSMCEYGNYLAIACQSPEGGVIYLWGRDTTLTTLQDVIKVDNGKLQIIENLDGNLISVSETPYDPNSGAIAIAGTFKTIVIRAYNGGSMRLLRQAYTGFNENSTNQLLSHIKAIRNGRLLFSTGSNFLWSFGVNKNGTYTLSRDAQVVATTKTLVSLYGFFVLGDYLFACQRNTTGSPSDGILYRTNGANSSTDWVDTAAYTFPINASMPIEDRLRDKTLTKVSVLMYTPDTNRGTVTLKYSTDNGTTFTTAISQSATFTRNTMRFEASANNDGTSFPTAIEFIFKVETIHRIDILDVSYEYENNN